MGQPYDRGLLLYRQRRYALAIDEFRRELEADPNCPWSLSMIALSLSKSNEHDAAIEAANAAIAASPTLYYPHFVLATALMDKHWRMPVHPAGSHKLAVAQSTYNANMGRTRKACVEAIERNPNHAESLGLLAAIDFNLRQYRSSLDAADRALRIDPTDVFAANLRSRSLIELGNLGEAEASLERTLAINPDNARTYANRGWLLMNRDDPQAAQTQFLEALRLDPNDLLAHDGMKAARRKLVWREQVRERWRLRRRQFRWPYWLLGYAAAIGVGTFGMQSKKQDEFELENLLICIYVVTMLTAFLLLIVALKEFIGVTVQFWRARFTRWRRKRRALAEANRQIRPSGI